MSDIVANIIVRVYVVGGGVMVHTYSMPTTKEEIHSLVQSLVDQGTFLRRSYEMFLSFDNPTIFYNPDNVIAVEIDTLGVKEMEAVLRKAHDKVGFVKK